MLYELSTKVASLNTVENGNPRALSDLTSLRIFTRVVEVGNFSEVARRMGLTPATVSKQIAALEERLGMRLLNRTTRKLSVTDAGQRLYDSCTRAIAELDHAIDDLSELQDRPTGMLRVTAPMMLGTRRVGPMLPRFLKTYPGIVVHLKLSVETVDLFEQRIDVAVRIADNIDPGLIAIKLAPYKRLFVAAPGYLSERGEPKAPEDLVNHNCLISRGATMGADWPFCHPTGVQSKRIHGNLSADQGEIIRQAALDGIGIMMASRWLIEEDLRSGRLVRILEDFSPRDRGIYAVLIQRTDTSRKLAAFVDELRSCFADLNDH